MKKILSVTLALCLLLGAVSVTAFATDESATDKIIAMYDYCDANNDGVINDADSVILCDFDGDGSVTTADAKIVLRIATGLIAAPDGKTGDVNNDGICGVDDARTVLRIAAGIDSVFSDSAILEYVTAEANWVKSAKPGFTQNTTSVVPSTKISVSGYSVSTMNCTDLEMKDYIEKMKPLLLLAGMRDEYERMVADVNATYEPKTSSITVNANDANKHYSYYPVKSYFWAMKLTDNDIKDITYTLKDGNILIKILFDEFTYTGDEYPTSYYALQKEPYGKAFNLSAYKATNDYSLDSFTYKDGSITYKIDAATGNVLSSDYYYASIAKCTSEQTEPNTNSKITMKMTVNSNYTESYVINTPEA